MSATGGTFRGALLSDSVFSSLDAAAGPSSIELVDEVGCKADVKGGECAVASSGLT